MGRQIARLRLAGVKVVSLFFGDLPSCEGRGLRRVPCLYELEEQLRLLRSRMTNVRFSIFKTSAVETCPDSNGAPGSHFINGKARSGSNGFTRRNLERVTRGPVFLE